MKMLTLNFHIQKNYNFIMYSLNLFTCSIYANKPFMNSFLIFKPSLYLKGQYRGNFRTQFVARENKIIMLDFFVKMLLC